MCSLDFHKSFWAYDKHWPVYKLVCWTSACNHLYTVKGEKSTKLHVHFCLNSAGKHGTLTSGFSNVTSTARAVGVKKLRLCAGLFSTAQHAQRGKLLICLLCLPLLLVSGFCKQRVSCRRTSIIMFLFSFSVTKKMPLKMLLNKESLAKQHKIAANTKTLQSQSD